MSEDAANVLSEMVATASRPSDMTQLQTRQVAEWLERDFVAFNYLVVSPLKFSPNLHGQACRMLEKWGTEGHRRLMIQSPRESWKCEHPDNIVSTSVGPKRMGDLQVGDELVALGDDLKLTTNRVVALRSGHAPCLQITTRTNRQIIVTENHPLYTFLGWKRADEFRVGDPIALVRSLPRPPNFQPYAFAWAAGVVCGDGCLVGQRVLDAHDPEIVEEMDRAIGPMTRRTAKGRYGLPQSFWRAIPKSLHCLSIHKRIPEEFEGSAAFLRGMFDTDGTVSPAKKSVILSTTSEGLAKDTLRNLLYFGIFANHYTSVSHGPNGFRGTQHQVAISGNKNLEAYAKHIGFVHSQKRTKLEALLGVHTVANHADTIPTQWKGLLRCGRRGGPPYQPGEGQRLNKAGIRVDNHYWTTREKVSDAADLLGRQDLYLLATSDIRWDDIKSIEPLGLQPIVQMEVSGNHSYVSQGFFCHNTTRYTRGMAIWRVVRNPNQTTFIVNEKVDRVQQWLGAIQNLVTTNDLFLQCWGHLLPPGVAKNDTRPLPKSWPWNSEKLLFVREVTGIPEVSITAGGVTGASAGGHWDWLIFDDLISEDAARSPVVMQSVKDWLDTSIYLGKGGLEYWNCLVNCTRWSYDDAYSYLVKKYGFRLYRRQALENGQTCAPELWTTEALLEHRELDPFNFACTPADTPITMWDYSTKPISEVNIGDTVMGFETGDQQNRGVLKEARVVDKGSLTAPVYEYGLSDGTFIRCTPDHKWYVGRLDRPSYREPAIGLQLCRLHPVEKSNHGWEAGYLAAIYDGEGSINVNSTGKRGGNLHITQSEKNPQVLAVIREVVSALGFDWKEVVVDTPVGSNYPIHHIRILGGREAKIRFLQLCRPKKIEKILESLQGSRWAIDKPRIISARYLESQTVYWLQTETGNYFAHGLASKNSQMQNEPMAGKDTSFQQEWVRGFKIGLDDHGDDLAIIHRDHFDPAKSMVDFEPSTQSIPLHQMTKTLLVDPAPSSDTERKQQPNARSALVMKGIDYFGRRYWLDIWAGREEPIARARRIISMMKRWGTHRLGVEEVVFSTEIGPWIKYLAQHEFQGYHIQYIPLRPGRRDKDSRIMGKAHAFSSGFEYVNDECRRLLLEELLTYPHSATRDIIDAGSYDEDPGVLPRPESPGEAIERLEYEFKSQHSGERGVTGYGA